MKDHWKNHYNRKLVEDLYDFSLEQTSQEAQAVLIE